MHLREGDGGQWRPAEYNLKHILRDFIFIVRRGGRTNSNDEGKRPRFRYDGLWCRGFESFNYSVKEGRCNIHDDDAFGSRGFFGGEFDCEEHCFSWEGLRENIEMFEGLEKGGGVDGKYLSRRAGGSGALGARGSKRDPMIGA